jgi:hypothetical protein
VQRSRILPPTDWSRTPRDQIERYPYGGGQPRPLVPPSTAELNRQAARARREMNAARRRAEWQADLDEDERAGGGPVEVRPHVRDGRAVQGHTRGAPSR